MEAQARQLEKDPGQQKVRSEYAEAIGEAIVPMRDPKRAPP